MACLSIVLCLPKAGESSVEIQGTHPSPAGVCSETGVGTALGSFTCVRRPQPPAKLGSCVV